MADNLKQIPGLPNYYLTSEGNAVKQEPSWWDKVKSYGKAALNIRNEEAPYFIPGIATYKFAEDAGNNFNTAILQVKDGDYNAIASTATGLGNTLMGVVSLAPFIGGGVKVATKLANNFNRALKAARTQIVAKAFDNQVKNTIPKITVPEVSPITPENAASITPEQWTAAQDAAIARGDMSEAQRLRDLHASVSGYNSSLSLYHGSPEAFNLFEATPNFGDYVDYHSHFSTNPTTALKFGDVRRFYTNVKTPLRVTDQGAIWEPLNLARELGIQPKGGKHPLEPYWQEFQNIKGRGMYKEANRKFMELELRGDAYIYDNVIEGGGDSYAIPTSRQVKLADAVTYDDKGIRIPLGKRDNFNINDIRYGLVPWFLAGTTAAALYNKSLDTPKLTEKL